MFDILDERFNEYLKSTDVSSDEFEAIQMVSDVLDIFELQSRKTLLGHRNTFDIHQKNKTFISQEEKNVFEKNIQDLAKMLFENKMGEYVGKK